MKKSMICLMTAAMMVMTACSSTQSESAAPEAAPETTPQATPLEDVSWEEAAEPAQQETPAPETAAPADLYAMYVTEFPDVGTLAKPVDTDDGRALNLECLLNNEVDQLIYDHYRYELLGDPDGALALVGNNENMRITVKNGVRNVQEGAGVQSYTLHDMYLLTPEEVQNANEFDRQTIGREVADYGLEQWTVEAVDLSWTYTDAAQAKGPQLDEGRYQRYFLLGRSADDDRWKIYDFFWEDFLVS